ncbi:MAG: branched-chain amino acid ABC transporter permease [Christensenellales bacterium]|jgi:branched-chain amino acid transport system permease protein
MKFFKALRRHWAFTVALLFLLCPFVFSVFSSSGSQDFLIYIFDRGFINAIAVIGLVILYGLTGQVSLGNMAFFALGAYTSAILSIHAGVPVMLSVIGGIMVASVFGALISIPSFKLTGPFLSITTVAFGEIIRLLAINLVPLTGGPSGTIGVPGIALSKTKYIGYLAMSPDFVWYFILLAFVVLSGVIGTRIKHSQYGRAFYAVKEDEVAAALMGVNVRRMKTISFTFAAFLSGVAGALFAHFSGFLSPDMFGSAQSFNLFSMTVLGGSDSVLGGALSAVAVTLAPEVLRFLQEYYMMILNIIILIVVLVPWKHYTQRVKDRWMKKRSDKKAVVS